MLRSPELRVAREEGQLTLSQPSRRLFLGAALGASLLPALVSAEDPENEIRRFIENFPKQIPGIARITIPVMPKKPKRMVGVWEQIHWEPSIPANEAWHINDCQRELRLGYQHVMNHPSVRMTAMRGEAVFVGDEEKHARVMRREIAEHAKRAAELAFCGDDRYLRALEPPFEGLQRYLDVPIDGYTAEARWGAAEVLQYTGGLRVLAAETQEVYDACLGLSTNHPDYKKRTFYRREETGFGLTNGLADWITYGCAHDFVDDALFHNEDFPDDQVALMLLTPKTVEKYYSYPSPKDAIVYRNVAA